MAGNNQGRNGGGGGWKWDGQDREYRELGRERGRFFMIPQSEPMDIQRPRENSMERPIPHYSLPHYPGIRRRPKKEEYWLDYYALLGREQHGELLPDAVLFALPEAARRPRRDSAGGSGDGDGDGVSLGSLGNTAQQSDDSENDSAFLDDSDEGQQQAAAVQPMDNAGVDQPVAAAAQPEPAQPEQQQQPQAAEEPEQQEQPAAEPAVEPQAAEAAAEQPAAAEAQPAAQQQPQAAEPVAAEAEERCESPVFEAPVEMSEEERAGVRYQDLFVPGVRARRSANERVHPSELRTAHGDAMRRRREEARFNNDADDEAEEPEEPRRPPTQNQENSATQPPVILTVQMLGSTVLSSSLVPNRELGRLSALSRAKGPMPPASSFRQYRMTRAEMQEAAHARSIATDPRTPRAFGDAEFEAVVQSLGLEPEKNQEFDPEEPSTSSQ